MEYENISSFLNLKILEKIIIKYSWTIYTFLKLILKFIFN